MALAELGLFCAIVLGLFVEPALDLIEGWASRPTSSRRQIGFVLHFALHTANFKLLPNWLCFARLPPGNADLLIGVVSGIGFV